MRDVRVEVRCSAEDLANWKLAAAKASLPLASWMRNRLVLASDRNHNAADSIARFEALTPPVATKVQEFAERIVPAMVKDAAEMLAVPKPAVITAPARKVPLPPSKRRGKSADLKEAGDGVVPGPSEPMITAYPLTGIPRVRPSAPAAAGIPEIPDFEELMVDVSGADAHPGSPCRRRVCGPCEP